MEFVQPIRDRKKIDRMKRFLRQKNLRDYCLFVLGINSGLRISDLLRLRVGDVVREDRSIRDRIDIREQKTDKAKNFPISTTAQQAIKEYIQERAKKSGIELGQALFLSQKKGALQRAQAWTILNEAARVVGIEGRIGTHSLRKTFGYHAYKQGVDLAYISELLNHASVRETKRYIGITQDELDEIYLNLNI